jgi:transcriptional regulator with XRE-family HTH domain
MKRLLPRDSLKILRSEFGLGNQDEIARFLGLTQPRVSQINNSNNLTKEHVRKLLRGAFQSGKREGHGEMNAKLLETFGKLRSLDTQVALAMALDKTQGAVAQWKSGYAQISEKTIELILKKSAQLTIRPLVEMEEVDPGQPGASHWYFYNAKTNTRRKHLLRKLNHKKGIYLYFDATGRPTYVGKADKTPLDKEVENRLNHELKSGRIPYGENMEQCPKLRQGEIVRYISAYEISPREAIPLVEALVIRSTANVLFNKQLEKLSG